MDGVYWCMQFVWWCFQQVDKSLFMDGGKTAPCGELMRWAQAHGQWVTTGYRPGDADLRLPGHVVQDRPERQRAVCHRHRGQYLQRQHRQPVQRRRGVSPQAQAVAVAWRVPPEVSDYRAQLQKRAGLEDKTMDYLAAYKYGADLIRKLATMKQFARFGQNPKGCVQRGHSLIHDNIFDNKTVPKHSETAQKFPLRPYLLRQNFGCWENEKTLKLQ